MSKKGLTRWTFFLWALLLDCTQKNLIIQNDVQSVSKSSNPKSLDSNQIRESAREEQSGAEHLETLKSIFNSDRLSNSVSDYVSRLEKQDYSDYANGFYMSQLDNLAKAFVVPSKTARLTEFAEQNIASMKQEKDEAERIAKEDNKKLLKKEQQKCKAGI